MKSAFVVASTQTIILLLFGCLGTAALLTQLGHLAFFERVKGSDMYVTSNPCQACWKGLWLSSTPQPQGVQ